MQSYGRALDVEGFDMLRAPQRAGVSPAGRLSVLTVGGGTSLWSF